MSFRDEIEVYFDKDGLIGTSPHPKKWSGGNQILDTAQRIIYLHDTKNLTIEDKLQYSRATLKCEDRFGIINKNPERPDEITHDCIIGHVVASALTGTGFEFRFLYFIKVAKWYPWLWVASNTGKLYWTAIVKPWHKAFYKHMAQPFVSPPSILGYTWLAVSILHDAIFNKKNASDKKVMWVMIYGLLQRKIKSKYSRWVIVRAIAVWFVCFERLGAEPWMMTEYYKTQSSLSPFAKYAAAVQNMRR